ncbi:MAG: ribonuclease P protein component [Methylophilaceae bacterium]
MEKLYRLPKQAKLVKTDEFSSVFNFRKRITANYLVIHYLPNAYQRARLGLVVSKKVAKLAVRRNYMRRLLRECFRLKQHEIAHLDIVIRVQKKFSKREFLLIKQEFELAIIKINQRVGFLNDDVAECPIVKS